ncbi:MAG: hypothetical protein WC616_05980 [Candidatus Omnitrophota bacterium]
MNYWETKGTILIIVAMGILLLVGQCRASGELSLILNNVVPNQDWSGSEKSSSAWGLTCDYNKSAKIGSITTLIANAKMDYSQRKIEGKSASGKDEVRCKLDISKERKNIGVKDFLSLKTYTHFKDDKYNIYLKYGIGQEKTLPFVVKGTAKLVVLNYATKVSISQNWQDNRAMSARLGALLELDVAIKTGKWAITLDDGDVFFSGGRTFELPVAIEFVKRPLFVKQSWLIRGDTKEAGCLRTFEAGLRFSFK